MDPVRVNSTIGTHWREKTINACPSILATQGYFTPQVRSNSAGLVSEHDTM